MKTIKRIGVSVLLGFAALTVSPAVWALGLGDATVQSYLDQPLQVRIDLITQETDDLSSLTARLASAEDYQLIGANRESIPVPVSFSIEDLEADAYIRATSDLPFNNPVLRLIVEVEWSNGRLLREYTLFLDPPAAPAAAPAPRLSEPEEAARVPAAPPQPSAEPATEPRDRPARATIAAEPTAPRAPASVDYGPVQNGETLWGIARNLSRDTGLGINQTMIAIQRENPNAFLRGNINLLKRGAILRLPSAEQVAGVSRAEANREVELQAEAFAERSSAATVASPETPLLAADAAAEPAERAPSVEEPPAPEAGEAEPTASEEAPQEAAAVTEAEDLGAADQPESDAGLRDQLELVPPAEDSDAESAGALGEPEAEGDSAAAVASLRENLARTEEELYNQRQQNAYLEERIRELEAQAEAASGSVEDEELASMEERLRQERQAAAAAREEPLPWYANLTLWLFVLLGVAIVVIVWLLLRGRKDQGDSLAGITGEAEEVLRALEDEEKPSAEKAPGAEEEQPAAEQAEATVEQKTARTFGETGDDAEFLDAESSDPEIQLDLARAYISMGDKEAARAILEEVVANGNEEQKAEAEKMLDLL